jgi:AraC-like DNA-binding protein
MQARKPANQPGRETGRSARARERPAALRAAEQPVPGATSLLQRKYRGLVRKHLSQLLDGLFAEFTGVHFHIVWAPSPAREWPAGTLPTGGSVCCRLSGSPRRPGCRVCGPKQLARALVANGEGHRFTCRFGVRNYWFPLQVRGEMLGIAYLQALNHAPGHYPARQRAVPQEARVLNQADFERAGKLLRLIVEHVQTASLSDLRKADLTSAGHALLALEREQARLHESLQSHLPPPAQAARRATPVSHPEQLVQRLLERIEGDYGQPITLQHCAHELGMNAAYLSSLFSQAVGVPFKTHLTARRLEKARELLSNPAKTASEVANAVGYSSEDRFRSAFKQATGLAPKVWREMMETRPPESGCRHLRSGISAD